MAGATVLVGFLGFSNSAQALPLVVLDDQYTTTNPSTGTNVTPPNTFTSDAVVGGTTTYTVDAGTAFVGFAPSIVFFGGAETSGSFFTVLDTIAGDPYEVDFTTSQVGNPTTHAINVNAFNGNGVGGSLLGSSGPVGINDSGNFTFTATSNETSPNASSDISFDNLQISTEPQSTSVPEPSSILGLFGLGGFAIKQLAKNSKKK